MSQPNWSLVTVRNGAGTEEVAALLGDGRVARVPPEVRAPGLMALLESWAEAREHLRDWSPDGGDCVENAVVLTPLRYPRKLICVAANYADHVREMGDEPPADPPAPYFFLLPPTTTLVAHGQPVRVSPDPAWRVDWEAELAVVIGRGGRGIGEDDALAHVAGFSILNDVTARGLQRREAPLGPAFAFDMLGAKGVDTFCPMGPGMTPAWLVANPQALTIKCWINGVLKQDSTTAQMLVELPRLIASISERITLEPGDVIATGTPAGVGNARGEQLGPGDRITIEIEGLGSLTNPIETDA
jgi:2-keto-4-pentenoate hydratase/2-oxohepta-3-ene-1,7-dioic acid hydratase in catechol pathway